MKLARHGHSYLNFFFPNRQIQSFRVVARPPLYLSHLSRHKYCSSPSLGVRYRVDMSMKDGKVKRRPRCGRSGRTLPVLVFGLTLALMSTGEARAKKEQLPFGAEDITHRIFIEVQIGSDTELERIEVGLYGNAVPQTVENFRALATGERGTNKRGVKLSYEGSLFHRVKRNFMIQGGDIVNSDGTGYDSIYGEEFPDENLLLKHKVGSLSMANAGKNTNGCQFFITTVRTDWLDGRHVVFGRVLTGMDTVYEIEGVKVEGNADRPVVPVVIKRMGEMPV